MTTNKRDRRAGGLGYGVWICVVLAASVTCDDDDTVGGGGLGPPVPDHGEDCRFHPDDCGHDVGSACNRHSDCDDNYCCTEEKNCRGGMCSIPCDTDHDCPSFMACEHDICFFSCSNDADCADGMKCEHMNTVCEWP